MIRSFNGKKFSFNGMVKELAKRRHSYLIDKGTFRIRFSQENCFCGVDKNLTASAEKIVINNSSLKTNRLNPSTEIWYIIRNEGIGFCCQLLFNRKTTEKGLHKGELKPEFAYLMCEMIPHNKGMVVCDPFCGYGSIIKQLQTKHNIAKIYASDIDEALVKTVSKFEWVQTTKIELSVMDARKMESIPSKTLDAIITDPPWGYYEKIDNIEQFYIDMFKEFCRVIKKNGKLVILSARKDEFELVLSKQKYIIYEKIDTLINGKKASIYVINM